MISTLYTLRRYQVEADGQARSIYTITDRGGRIKTLTTAQQAAAWVRRIIH